MRNVLFMFSALLLAIFSVSVFAVPLDKATIPEKVTEQFYKRHPNAVDVVAEQKKHFKQDLFLLEFKEGDERKSEYFRGNGHFFVAGTPVVSPKTSDLLPANNATNLTAEFSSYEFKKAIMVINPNGVGEEFDFIISNATGDWDVSMDKKGNITDKQKR